MRAGFIRAGIVGWPVKHSLSPLIHNHWMKRYGIAGEYGLIETGPEDLARTVDRLMDEGYRGFNVTIPHKESIVPLCDTLDEAALRIGAVNTVAIDEDGMLRGMNTDAVGFIASVKEALPDFNFRTAPTLVLGAGGAARAVVFGLLREGVPEIRVANRTQERADRLAADFGIEAIGWDRREECTANAGLLVNTTALGMEGQPPLPFDVSALPQGAAICDIVYKPRMTSLLRDAQRRGLSSTVEGIGMLLHQARPAFEAWTGVMPEVDSELRIRIDEVLT